MDVKYFVSISLTFSFKICHRNYEVSDAGGEFFLSYFGVLELSSRSYCRTPPNCSRGERCDAARHGRLVDLQNMHNSIIWYGLALENVAMTSVDDLCNSSLES